MCYNELKYYRNDAEIELNFQKVSKVLQLCYISKKLLTNGKIFDKMAS